MRDAVILHHCPCCGHESGLPVYMAAELADFMASYGALKPSIDDRCYVAPTVCRACMSAALVGDSAPCGVDMPQEFYNTLVRGV